MADQQLCDLLNEFYEDIRPDLVESVFSAIKAAESANEFVHRPGIFEALRRLILNLSNPQQDDSVAINIYMANNATRGSSTRSFFYHITLPGNLNQDDSPIYPPPPPSLEGRTSWEMAPDEWAEVFLSQPSFSQLPSSLPPLPPLPYSFPPLSLSLPPLPSSFPPLSLPLPPLPSSFPPLSSVMFYEEPLSILR